MNGKCKKKKASECQFWGGTQKSRKQNLHMTQILHVLYLSFHYFAFLGTL